MADVKWIKITTDMFDNRKIKHLRRLPEGNNIVLIWVMLLTMAGRCNANGMIFLTENIPYTPKMLADELDFEENTVRLALEALEQLGMIRQDGFLSIAGWEDHQNIEGLDKIREQNRIRQARFKEKRKALASGNVTGNTTITQGNATDIEGEEDKEEEVEVEEEVDKDEAKASTPSISAITADIINYLNSRTGSAYRSTTKKTQSLIKARIKEGFTPDDFLTVIDTKVAEWGRDPKMAQYLRPETLFGSHFESYLNQRVVPQQNNQANQNQGFGGYQQKQSIADQLNGFYNMAVEFAASGG